MTEINISFGSAFQALTDFLPMRWQSRLYKQVVSSKLPNVCDLPTGLGKTSVIPIWLIALAARADDDSVGLPRRLIYIVNRRTVVDQATVVVEKIRNRLLDPNNPSWQEHALVLTWLASGLRHLSVGLDDLPLAVSTLRGELADNEEWKADPTRPAIIIGTIDMIGSKLLFSGYGDGRYYRPHHAGLIGQDSLIIHDEAHLTPAFSDLLHSVAEAQRQAGEMHPVWVMELSATRRGSSDDVFTLNSDDEKDDIVKDRLSAKKNLHLIEIKDEEDITTKLAELSHKYEDSASRVLIYVRAPKDAQKVVDHLRRIMDSPDGRIALLTGTIRGHERDKLVKENLVYRALLNHDQKVERTVYLVSTSAGEVGIDLDADHLVCDLATLDSMIQRLGRVNRRGGADRTAEVTIIVQKSKEREVEEADDDSQVDQALTATKSILARLRLGEDGTYDASPGSLRELFKDLEEAEKDKAFSPKPPAQPLTDILLDAWSLTSIMRSMPGRPEVAPYLHGLTIEPPETYVVWRKEVALLDKFRADSEVLGEWFQECRIQPWERLRNRTFGKDGIKETLEKLLEEHRKTKKDATVDFPVIILNERGEAARSRLSTVVMKESNKELSLVYRTVVLPVEIGGLTPHGTLDGKMTASKNDLDVAEAAGEEEGHERWLHIRTKDDERWERLVSGEVFLSPPANMREVSRITLKAASDEDDEEAEERFLVLMNSPKQTVLENPETAKTTQTIEQHSSYIENYAARIATALRLDRDLSDALVTAARWHDKGKDRTVWQRFACNNDQSTALAKSTKYLSGRSLGGYRHEFGSLLDASADNDIKNHPERDVILHLIATHHGWARPHFEQDSWDQSSGFTTLMNEQASAEVMRRFGRLQQRFGRWGLCWLEALLRCADIMASKQIAEAALPAKSEEVQA